ncbi:uncharacterized protein LOC127861246 isoform X2 [Dreissena polymorpha]|uniref:uncharacterized protein LOC127861246 isoform X2 n=1 Tax=Dreissena polymorpha TaxID=45954 RepID=UPI002264EABE|nr:uncharacterized protein LOC127861246 isoform X2 [Dreissena polymorpha]
MDTNTNLNGETKMSTDAVDFLSKLASVSICDANQEANTDHVERLDSSEPMSADGRASLRSSDSDLYARGPQRHGQRQSSKDTTHPYAHGTAPYNTLPVLTSTCTNNQGLVSNVYSPQDLDHTLLPLLQEFNRDMADKVRESMKKNGSNANNYPSTAGDLSIIAAPNSSQMSSIELSPEPANTSPSSGYVSSQDPNQCDSASIPSADLLDYALDLWDELQNPGENINFPDMPSTITLQTGMGLNSNNALFSTPMTYCTASAANGQAWKQPTHGCTTNPPTDFLQKHTGVISNDIQPQPNIPETLLCPAVNGTQVGHPAAPIFIQDNQMAVNVSSPTDIGYIPPVVGKVLFQTSSNTFTNALDMDPQANHSSALVVNGTKDRVTGSYKMQPFLYGASDQIAMANVTYSQTPSSNEIPCQINTPLSYWTISDQTSAPGSYPQARLSDGMFGQVLNALQQQTSSSGTCGQMTTLRMANQQSLATHGTSNQILNTQQYKQPPPYGIPGQTNAQMSYPLSAGISGQMVKEQAILRNRSPDQVYADTKMIYNRSVNPGRAPGMPNQIPLPTAGVMSQRMVQPQSNMGQYVPHADSAPLKNQPISGSSQIQRQSMLGSYPVNCMSAGPASIQQILPVTQALQGIQQSSYTVVNADIALNVNNSHGFQTGLVSVYNGCSPGPQVVMRHPISCIVSPNGQSGPMYIAIQPKLSADQACQSSNNEKAQQSRKKRGTNMKHYTADFVGQKSAEAAIAVVPSLTVRDASGDTPLHVAVCRNDPYLIKAMLSRLEHEGQLKWMDCKNNKEQTPLYCAVFLAFHGVVSVLVEKGADPNCMAVHIKDSNGKEKCKSAIHVASKNTKEMDYKRTLSALLKSDKLNINNTNNSGRSALHCAILAQSKNPDHVNSEPTLRLLLDAGADVRMRDKDGLTPLMHAVIKKQVKLVKFLIEYCGGKGGKAEAIVKDTDYHRRTAQDMASEIRDTIGTEIWNILNNMC